MFGSFYSSDNRGFKSRSPSGNFSPCVSGCRNIFRFKADYQGPDNAQYDVSIPFRQLVDLGKVKFHSRITEIGFSAIVHIFKQSGHLPEVFPLHAKIVSQNV